MLKQIHDYFKKKRDAMAKSDSELLGRRLTIPREGLPGVDANIYIPSVALSENLPVIFCIHGGAFVRGDADRLDSFCHRVKELWGSVIVAINYTKVDEKPLEYSQAEIVDTVVYFRDQAEELHLDPEKFAILGFSSGGQLSANASLLLARQGFDLAGLVLCYPYVEGILTSVNHPFEAMPATTMVLCGKDPLSLLARAYAKNLEKASVPLEIKEYEKANHGFLEMNNPEFQEDEDYWLKHTLTPDQEALARECEGYLRDRFMAYFNKELPNQTTKTP